MNALRWKHSRSGRRVFAMGCLTQRDGEEVAESLPELDGVFGIGEWSRMIEALGANPVASNAAPISEHVASAGPGSAYLRISDGCSHACAFCAVPQMRGLYRSIPTEDLLEEARRLVESGVREIILIGQETTGYGVDLYRERRVVDLCFRLSEMNDLHWIRVLYTHPPSTPPSLLEELARVPKLAPYLDYPIEHASDRMLQRMNRRTSAARMKEAIAAFRSVRPGAAVRTTVLIGFPGERDEDFDALCRFMEEVRFERAGAFVYSPQDDTAGSAFSDAVEEGIALDRLDQLMRLQQRICAETHQTLVGSAMDVLIERTVRGASWGRSGWDAPDIDGRVRVEGVHPLGSIVTGTVTRAYAYRLDVRPHPRRSENALRESWDMPSRPALSR